MRKALTMIELTFVIVIIGLLSGIAALKFTATRDDAKVSQIAKNVIISSQEIAAYVAANGKYEKLLSDMSNAVSVLIMGSNAVQSGDTLHVSIGTVSECIYMKIDGTTNVHTIDISYGDTKGDYVCKSLQRVLDEKKYDIPILGSTVKR